MFVKGKVANPDAAKHRDPVTGKLINPDMEKFRRPGVEGLAWFINKHVLRVMHSDNAYRPIKLLPFQGDFFKKGFQKNPKDTRQRFKHQVICFCGPRRHTKSTNFAIAVLWRAICFDHTNVILLGPTEWASEKNQFNMIKNIILNSKSLHKYFLKQPLKYITQKEIRFPKSKSTVSMISSNSISNSFGSKVDICWVSDIHAFQDLSPFYNLQSSALDSNVSLVFIDGNPDDGAGPLSDLEVLSKTDPSVYFHRIQYSNFQQYLEEAPAFIDRAKAKRLKKQLLPATFDRDILGKNVENTQSLFPPETIEVCKDSYPSPLPYDKFKVLIQNRKHVICGSLDRADSDWGSAFSSADDSIATITGKVAPIDGSSEPEYYVLDSHTFVPSTSRSIKKYFLKMHKEYNFTNISLEQHSTQDINTFFLERGLPSEMVAPSSTWQNAVWPEVTRICREGRLHVPNSKDGHKLLSQMATMIYKQLSGRKYSFGASSKKYKDDAPFSLAHSINSSRDSVLNTYVLARLICNQLSKASRDLCFLFQGNLEMPCARNCEAYNQVAEYYDSYMGFQTESELTLPDFYKNFVSIDGPILWQAA